MSHSGLTIKKTCLQNTDNNFVPYDVVDCQSVPCTAKPHAALFVCHTGLRLLPAGFSWIMWSLSKAKGCLCVSGPFEIKRLGILPAGIHDCCRAACDREWEKQMEVAVRWSRCRFTLHFTVHQTQCECTHTCTHARAQTQQGGKSVPLVLVNPDCSCLLLLSS